MKITCKEWKTKRYGDLNRGDVFTYNNNVFMKTDQPEEVSGKRMRAVSLSTGEMNRFGENILVHPVCAELII